MADGSVTIKVDVDSKDVKNQLSKIKSNISSGMKAVGKATGAALGIVSAGITAVATASVKISETTDRVDKMSQRLGLSREKFQEWDFILSQSGASLDSMQMGMKTLTQQMEASTKSGSNAADIFKRLGVNVKNANGNFRNQEDVFEEVITGLQAMDDGLEKASIAQKLFGRNGQELLPVINADAESIDDMKNKAHDLGLVLSDETVDAGVKLTDTMDQLKRSGTALITTFLTPMVDPVNELLQGFIGLATGVEGSEQRLSESLSNMATKTINLIVEILPTVAKLGIDVIISLTKGIINSIPELVGTISYALGYLVGTILNNKDKILETGSDILTWILDGIQSLFGNIAGIVGSVIRKIIDHFSNEEGDILETGKNILIWLLNGITSVLSWIIDTDVKIINSFLSGITGKQVDILETGKKVLTWFVDGVKNIIEDVTDVGKYVVEGFLNGITNAKNMVVDGAKSFGKGFLTTLKNILDIHSPSGETESIADYAAEGWMKGINDAKSGMISQTEEVGTDLLNTIKNKSGEANEAGKEVGDAIATGVKEGTSTISDDLKTELENAQNQLHSWKDDITLAFQSIVSGFKDIGTELANGEFSWSSFGKIAIKSLADVLAGLAAQLTALAAVKLLTFDFGGAALAGGGAAAAALAAGFLSAKAASYDVGGIIKEDQLANIHKHEMILPKGITADAKQNGLMIAPLRNKRINTPLDINIDGERITRVIISHIDDEIGLTNVG